MGAVRPEDTDRYPLQDTFVGVWHWKNSERKVGDPYPGEIMDKLTSMEFTDSVEGDDTIELRFDNSDLTLLDHPLLTFGVKMAVMFGYRQSGEFSPLRVMEVQGQRQKGKDVVIKAKASHQLVDEECNWFVFARTGPVSRGGAKPEEGTKNVIEIVNPGVPDELMFERMVERIGEENGFRVENVKFRGIAWDDMRVLKKTGRAIQETGFYQFQKTWAQLMDILCDRVFATWRVHDNLLIVEGTYYTEDRPTIELLFGDVVPMTDVYRKRDIFPQTINMDSDLSKTPGVVVFRGFDIEKKEAIQAIKDLNRDDVVEDPPPPFVPGVSIGPVLPEDLLEADANIKKDLFRKAAEPSGVFSLAGEDYFVNPYEGSDSPPIFARLYRRASIMPVNPAKTQTFQSSADNQERLNVEAAAESRAARLGMVKLEGETLAAPTVSAGEWVWVTLPSAAYSGRHKIKQIRHRWTTTSPFTSSFVMEREFLEPEEEKEVIDPAAKGRAREDWVVEEQKGQGTEDEDVFVALAR